MTRTALGLADDFANGIIGKRIIELARAGERRPDLACLASGTFAICSNLIKDITTRLARTYR